MPGRGDADEVCVLRVDLRGAPALAPEALGALASTLDVTERARAARFVFDDDRARFLVAHAAQRRCLAGAVGCRASDVAFRYGAFGKPAIDGPAAGGEVLHFNMSHARSAALIAWGRVELGIDIEDVGDDVDEIGVAATVFTAREQADLAAIPAGEARRGAFFDLWTKKEALLKGLGTGLSREAATIDVGAWLADPSRPSRWIDVDTGDAWTVAAIDVGPERRAAIATRGGGVRIRWA